MPEHKKSDFVVTDRRKFTAEGEVRGGGEVKAEEPRSTPPKAILHGPEAQATTKPPMPEAPTAAEQQASRDAYQESGHKLDQLIADQSGAKPRAEDFEMTFERLVVSLYMTALVQLGLVRREDEPAPQPDLIGARQTIDTISLLGDKTKGNLTGHEENVLQNCLFELRMAFLEVTNALTRPPQPGEAPVGGKK